jgi:hypothetical protein
MKTKLLAGLLLAASSMFAGVRIGVGVGIGVPVVAPPVVYAAPAAYVPPCPGPGYVWTAGYWYPYAGRRVWRSGYWAAPAVVVGGPHYYGRAHYGGRYFRR